MEITVLLCTDKEKVNIHFGEVRTMILHTCNYIKLFVTIIMKINVQTWMYKHGCTCTCKFDCFVVS